MMRERKSLTNIWDKMDRRRMHVKMWNKDSESEHEKRKRSGQN